MYVRSGSLNDPEEFHGLAHFCEHMLFLGTKNRPEDEYTKYLTSNGGSRNAATSEDSTFFYFDVKNQALEGALERFSEFFKCPTFSQDGTDREIKAIDSEFKKNVSSELRRIHQIEKSHLTDKASVLRRFQAGNFESLNQETEEDKKKLREALIQYHDKHYSSNIMSLVVIGAYEIAELEKMV